MKLHTKSDFTALMHRFLDPLLPLYSEGGARLHLGDTGVTYPGRTIEMEAFSRPLWALAPFWTGGGRGDDFLRIYRKGLASGTDPESPEYWGDPNDYDQLFVEMAALACAILETPESVWEPLTDAEKALVTNYNVLVEAEAAYAKLVAEMGGLHKFMRWDGPMLTDSGGFQVFSLAGLRKITEEGVTFASHLDGHRIFMGPEESMQIQSHLGSDIAMAFDECVENPAQYDYAKASCERTLRWLERCKAEHDRLNALPDTVNPHQMLFGINQGATYRDLRIWHMQQIGLAVGEPTEVMYDIIEAVEPYMPKDKPRYLMGVGTPSNIVEGVARGVDFFDCVMPARNARHGKLFSWQGSLNIKNAKYKLDDRPIDPACDCPVCRRFSRAYLRHLFTAEEMLGMRLAVMHNLYFYNKLTRRIRESLDAGCFADFRAEYSQKLGEKL